jgi:hypothetical protein
MFLLYWNKNKKEYFNVKIKKHVPKTVNPAACEDVAGDALCKQQTKSMVVQWIAGCT